MIAFVFTHFYNTQQSLHNFSQIKLRINMNKQLILKTLSLSVLTAMPFSIYAVEAQNETAQLKTIVVTASSQAVDIKEAPASISVITREDIEKQPVGSLAELLSKVPGVTGGISPSGEGSKIKLRGLPDNYTLILVDGKRIGSSRDTNYRPDLGRQDLNWITPDMIERIEVVRGPMSSLYGSDAMGGVINIITKKIPNEWGGNVTLNYTQPTTSSDLGTSLQTGVLAAGPLTDTLGLRLTAGVTEREADKKYLAGSGTTGSQDQNYNAMLHYQPTDKQSVSFEVGHSIQKNEEGSRINPTTGIEQTTSWGANELKHNAYSISHDGEWEIGKSKLTAYYNDYDSSVAGSTTKSNELIVEGNLTMPFHAVFDQVLTVGGQWKKQELTNSDTIGTLPGGSWDGQSYTDPKVDNKNWALFLENNITLLDNLKFTVGDRLDRDDKYGTHHSPRGYLVFSPTDDLVIKGGVAKGFRAPTVKESSPGAATQSGGNGCNGLKGQVWYDMQTGQPLTYVSGGCYMTGNPNLKPEESTNYEIGVNYSGFGTDIGLTFFHTDFKNKIAYSPLGVSGGTWFTRNENIQNAVTRGLEMVANFPVLDNLKWSNNATYFLKAKNEDTGTTLLTTSKLTVNSSLNWQPTDPLNIDLSAQYLGKQYLTEKTTTSTMQKPHTIVNLASNYKVNDKLTVRGGFINLLDKKLSNGADAYLVERQKVFVGATYKF